MDMSEMMSKLRALVVEADAEKCNMTAEGEECPVHGMDECDGYMAEAKKGKKPDADGDGIPDWADKNPTKAGGDEDRKVSEDEEELDEHINITVDGPEADELIHRIMALAGADAHPDAHYDADAGQMACPSCGKVDCECDDDCGCGCPDGECTCGTEHEMPAMENADHDYGHVAHSDKGDTVDPDRISWRARSAPGTQGIVKGTMGDNPLIKEDSDALYAKLSKDYKTYVAEADLARSNTGAESPLTATDRDEFDKDPFAGDEPVTDGSRSPLSTIKRQKVSK